MRWPFVSREWYEEVRDTRASISVDNRALRDALEAERARYNKLFDAYAALRVSGANAPQAPAGLAPAERPRKPADEAIETVVAKFGGNWRLRRQLQKYVFAERMKPDADEEQIADNVLHWRDPENDEESA